MRFLRSTRFWLFAFAALILLSTVSMCFMRLTPGGTVAVITLDGEEIQRIDLSKVRDPYSIRVESTNGGYNIVHVEKGKISVTEASCPDKICIRQGEISNSLKPIVCLPNKMMIIIEDPETVGSAGSADSVSG